MLFLLLLSNYNTDKYICFEERLQKCKFIVSGLWLSFHSLFPSRYEPNLPFLYTQDTYI